MDYIWNKPIFRQVGYFFEIQYRFFKWCMIRKDENNNYTLPLPAIRLGHPNQNGFKGKLYVLINGGSFSASCILSSNLKGTKRAVFVGEETGGDYNGCVAGWAPEIKLPNSRLNLRLPLLIIQPKQKTNIEGHGIFPNVEIEPSLTDKINNIDPELNWVLDDIKKQ